MQFEQPFRLDDIECDGILITHGRDPPGQRSQYILPGDEWNEQYRILTFTKFPDSSRVNTRELASSGFLYTGYKDRVKCFSCGSAVENWNKSDDPKSITWHKLECNFIHKSDDINVPFVPGYFRKRETNSQSSTASVPMDTSRRDSGSCRSPSSQQTLTAGEVLLTAGSSLPSSSTNHTHHQMSYSSASQSASLFACNNPINPHMRTVQSRLATYMTGVWQLSWTLATPMQLAEAGLFCLGSRDRLKCWYCNGGLQHWEYDDDPWFEHAKWFPQCEYLLRNKGVDYVLNVTSQFPNLRRPTIRNASNVLTGTQVVPAFRLVTSQNNVSPAPKIIDPREEIQEIKRKIEKTMEESDLVKNSELMGFERPLIRAVIKRQYELHKCSFDNFESLVESILAYVGPIPTEPIEGEKEIEESVEETEVMETELEVDVMKELKRLEESKNCKICHQRNSQVVFLPCGHLVCCEECSMTTQVCPLCDVTIRERLRAYAS